MDAVGALAAIARALPSQTGHLHFPLLTRLGPAGRQIPKTIQHIEEASSNEESESEPQHDSRRFWRCTAGAISGRGLAGMTSGNGSFLGLQPKAVQGLARCLGALLNFQG